MVRTLKLAALAPVLALLAGCAGIAVRYDYDRGADFASYKTYAWYEGAPPPAGALPAPPGPPPVQAPPGPPPAGTPAEPPPAETPSGPPPTQVPPPPPAQVPAPPARPGNRPGTAANLIMDRRVRRLVEQELGARGYQLVPAGKADFLVAYYPVYQDRVVATYTDLGTAWGPGWGWRPWGWGVGGGMQEVQHYREGSIVLEVLDPRTRQVVWHAVGEGALNDLRTPQDAEEQVGEAIRRMLGKFPPPPKD
jgi:hypothetical protein